MKELIGMEQICHSYDTDNEKRSVPYDSPFQIVYLGKPLILRKQAQNDSYNPKSRVISTQNIKRQVPRVSPEVAGLEL